jgi:hypothetical protein
MRWKGLEIQQGGKAVPMVREEQALIAEAEDPVRLARRTS